MEDAFDEDDSDIGDEPVFNFQDDDDDVFDEETAYLDMLAKEVRVLSFPTILPD